MTEADFREMAMNVRVKVLGLLRTFASPDEQREYQRTVLIAAVPAELVCGWADDLYHPDTATHARAFSPAERAGLAGFDKEFRRWSAEVHNGDVEAYIASAAGVALARAAVVALAVFPVAPVADLIAGPDRAGG